MNLFPHTDPAGHEHALALIKRRMVKPLSATESADLEIHLSECVACTQEAQVLQRGIQNLRKVRPMAAAQLVRNTQLRCRQRAAEIELRRRKIRGVVLAGVISSAWILLSVPFVWSQLFAFGAGPALLLHVSFLLMWFMPAMVAGAIALWLRPQLCEKTFSAKHSFPRAAISGTLGAARALRESR